MVLPGHIGGGYIAARLVLFLTHASFSPVQTTILLIIGTLSGEGPDLDVIFFHIIRLVKKSDKKENHRAYITHTPIFWLTLSLAVVIMGYLCGSAFTVTTGWMILAGSWSHLILDSIEYGIRWLWPFSPKRFQLWEEVPHRLMTDDESAIAYYWYWITGPYWREVTSYAEIAVTLTALWLAFH